MARQAIIKSTFHRTTCPKCGRTATIDKPFFYVDFSRNSFIKVMHAADRHLWNQASATLTRTMDHVPEALSPSRNRQLRVVFGLGELREKLIAQDAGLDDRIAELLKVFVIADHPFLVKTPRVRLTLNKASADSIEFHASFDHTPGRFIIGLPSRVVKNLLSREDKLQQWSDNAHGDASLFNLKGDHWVNLWRFSPQPSALEKLHEYAGQVSAATDIDTTSKDFRDMLAGLPTGSHLPVSGKQDLGILFDYASSKKLNDLEQSLLQVRFGTILSDDWAIHNDQDNIATIYKLLRQLPESNVEGNTSLHEIFLDSTPGGLYDPTTHDIHIGLDELSDAAVFQETVRHEVGHAVEDAHFGLIDPWRTSRFGWQMLSPPQGSNDWTTAIDHWVGLMGGWGTLTAREQDDVRGYLLAGLGNGSSWDPGPSPNPPHGHPWWNADFGPRLAFEKSETNWYKTYRSWHTYSGKAFFMNFWYATFAVVDVTTLDLIDKMPSNYASMSSSEFFAELYATFYDVTEKRRADIPQDVQKWLTTNIGNPRTGAPAIKPARPVVALAVERPGWYFTKRPI